jgi:hypothetical protein
MAIEGLLADDLPGWLGNWLLNKGAIQSPVENINTPINVPQYYRPRYQNVLDTGSDGEPTPPGDLDPSKLASYSVDDILGGAKGLFTDLGNAVIGPFQGPGGPSLTNLGSNIQGSINAFGDIVSNPINAAPVAGILGGLFGGPIGNVIGSGLGAYTGSYALDDSFSKTTGYNPDVSAWDQFWDAMTWGAIGESGSEQQQSEYDAFSGIDNVFGLDDSVNPNTAFTMRDLHLMDINAAAEAYTGYSAADLTSMGFGTVEEAISAGVGSVEAEMGSDVGSGTDSDPDSDEEGAGMDD